MDCHYTQYTELFPHHCNVLLLSGSVKTFQLLFSFFANAVRSHPFYVKYVKSCNMNAIQSLALTKKKIELEACRATEDILLLERFR